MTQTAPRPAPPRPPDEPEPFGIVVDRYRMVWQRFGPGWYSPLRPLVMLGELGRNWDDLIERRGPLAVLWHGGAPPGFVDPGDRSALEVATFAETGQTP